MYMCVCVRVCVRAYVYVCVGYVHVSVGTCESQRCQLFLKLVMQAVMSCLIWARELNSGPLEG